MEPERDKLQLVEAAEAFIAHTGATIRHAGDSAYYSPKLGIIQLPMAEAFRDTESYSATKAHELTHRTAHESRLRRDFGAKRFGDTGYAREELVAELGSALRSRFRGERSKKEVRLEASLRAAVEALALVLSEGGHLEWWWPRGEAVWPSREPTGSIQAP